MMKFDSVWKFDLNGVLKKGHFDTAINFARRKKGGFRAIEHARKQPWETWMRRAA